MEYIRVLSIAGSDCSGGAGIQADIKTFSALGCYAATVITAITVQNTLGVKASHPVSPEVVTAQLEAVLSDIRPLVIKIGMTVNTEIINAISDALKPYREIPVVLDPVMISTSGHTLIDDEAIEALTKRLFPLCTLVTPNLPETLRLTSLSIDTPEELHAAAQRILATGCHAVLIKGGHRTGDRCIDYLCTTADSDYSSCHIYDSIRIASDNTHGTGCTLSSAIAALLARGLPLSQAVEQAKTYLTNAIKHGRDVVTGSGSGPLNHLFAPEKLIIR